MCIILDNKFQAMKNPKKNRINIQTFDFNNINLDDLNQDYKTDGWIERLQIILRQMNSFIDPLLN